MRKMSHRSKMALEQLEDLEMPSSSRFQEDLGCKDTLDNDDNSSQASEISITDILQKKEQKRLAAEEAKERAEVIPLLLMHAYHLPGYTWKQDLWQYLSNNHPLFGIWWHHRHHPLGAGVRTVSLISSILFGLAVTNIIYLAFVFTQYDPDKEYIAISTNITQTGLQQDLDAAVPSLSVTTGNIALWTVGSLIHGFYDNTIWALAACTCMIKEGTRSEIQEEKLRRYRSRGTFLVNLATIVVVAIATFACMLRAAISADDVETTTIVSSHLLVHGELQKIEETKTIEFRDYEFVVSYLVELLLNYLIYYPLVGIVLFSGMLDCCGRFPIFGGRPYELKQLQEELEGESDVEDGVEVAWSDEGKDDSSTRSIETKDLENVETEIDDSEARSKPRYS
jgi:hypothetical protein